MNIDLVSLFGVFLNVVCYRPLSDDDVRGKQMSWETRKSLRVKCMSTVYAAFASFITTRRRKPRFRRDKEEKPSFFFFFNQGHAAADVERACERAPIARQSQSKRSIALPTQKHRTKTNEEKNGRSCSRSGRWMASVATQVWSVRGRQLLTHHTARGNRARIKPHSDECARITTE